MVVDTLGMILESSDRKEMKFKVKFRVSIDGGEKSKYSINMEEGASFSVGGEALGFAIIGVMTVQNGELYVSEFPADKKVTVNNHAGKKFKLRPGDLMQSSGVAVEFIELPFVEEADGEATRFLDISNQPIAKASQSAPVTVAPVPIEEKLEEKLEESAPKSKKELRREARQARKEQRRLERENREVARKIEELPAAPEAVVELAVELEKPTLPAEVTRTQITEASVSVRSSAEIRSTTPRSLTIASLGIAVFSLGLAGFVGAWILGYPRGLGFLSAIAGGLCLAASVSACLHLFSRPFELEENFAGYFRFCCLLALAALPWCITLAFSKPIVVVSTFMFWMAMAFGFALRFRPERKRFLMTAGIVGLFLATTAGKVLIPKNHMPLIAKTEENSPEPVLETSPARDVASVPGAGPTGESVQVQNEVAPGAPEQSVAETSPALAVTPEPVPPSAAPTSSVPDQLGQEEFFMAVKEGNLAMVKEAVQKKVVDPNFTLDKGSTALMHASARGHVNIVKYLLSLKVNINAQDPNGTTALMWAAHRGQKEVAQVLVKKGADPFIKRDDGNRALDIARRWNRGEIVKMLKSAETKKHRSIASEKTHKKKRRKPN